MKTAISIPDKLFNEAERTAKNLGISRSKLFCDAVKDYLELYNTNDITDKLNRIYNKKDKNKINSAIQIMQSLSIKKEEW